LLIFLLRNAGRNDNFFIIIFAKNNKNTLFAQYSDDELYPYHNKIKLKYFVALFFNFIVFVLDSRRKTNIQIYMALADPGGGAPGARPPNGREPMIF